MKVQRWTRSNLIRDCRLLTVGGVQLYADADAPAQGQADVLLDALPLLRHHQDVLPRHQVQQEQHRAASQVVLQLQVSLLFKSKGEWVGVSAAKIL